MDKSGFIAIDERKVLSKRNESAPGGKCKILSGLRDSSRDPPGYLKLTDISLRLFRMDMGSFQDSLRWSQGEMPFEAVSRFFKDYLRSIGLDELVRIGPLRIR